MSVRVRLEALEFEISFKIHYRTSKTLFSEHGKEFARVIEITDEVYLGGLSVVVNTIGCGPVITSSILVDYPLCPYEGIGRHVGLRNRC